MVILHITEILPAPIKDKERENDILLVSANQYSSIYPDTKHVFILIIPFVSFLISLISKRWREYYNLRNAESYVQNNYIIHVMALPMRGYSINWLRPLLNNVGYWLNKKRLADLIKKENITLIHAHNVYNTAFIAREIHKKENIPYVITTRKITSFYNNTSVIKNLTQASVLISISHSHKKLIDRLQLPIPSLLIPHGINDVFLSHHKKIKADNEPVKLVTLCRLISLKNIHKVLYALNEIDEDFKYDIYGDGPELDRIQSILSRLKIKNKVNLCGHVQHQLVPQMLSQYDIFVMPSYPETLGRVYLEAMALGIPVVGTKNTGIDGYVEDGFSGFLVDHKNDLELVGKLSLLIKDNELRKRLGEEGKKIASSFSWNAIIKLTHDAYLST